MEIQDIKIIKGFVLKYAMELTGERVEEKRG